MERISTYSPLCRISGEVIHGRGIGKLVGMPTANLELSSDIILPPNGVYITKILYNGCTYYGMTNIGTRPTVDTDSEISIETHILNFHREIYGERLEIELVQMLRGIRKFENYSSLLEQIRKDCIATQKFFGIPGSCTRLQMDAEKHRAELDHREVCLSNKEFDVLYLLYANPDVSFTKEQIYEAVWREPPVGCCHAVENTVFQIRKKLKPSKLIKTLVGRGYQYHAE